MNKNKIDEYIPSSFRDPSGFLFQQNKSIYRQVNLSYKENYNHLINSGLYETLVDDQLLIPHKEVDIKAKEPDSAYKIIEPELIPFISYPYEWSFSQLKNAALTTLEIQMKAFNFGMSLKDCSAYNIQFKGNKPVLIDTLSFEKYHEGYPWIAYRQFCQHFLAPLALMSYRDIRLGQLFRIYIDGIPLDFASSLLPFYTYFKFPLLSHIHLHAKSQKHFANIKKKFNSKHKMSHLGFMGIVDSLSSSIQKLKWQYQATEWIDYYDSTNYSSAGLEHKKKVVIDFLNNNKTECVCDFGANVGIFSRIASDRGIPTISFDIDPGAVEKNYLECIKKDETNILPLLLDLTNPSPGIGWENQERIPLCERLPVDTVFALALIHHLAISNNIPIPKVAYFFSKICNILIIEFIPKDDSQVQSLLLIRDDIFPNYTQQDFEYEFTKYFTVQHSEKIRDSKRILYLMKKK